MLHLAELGKECCARARSRKRVLAPMILALCSLWLGVAFPVRADPLQDYYAECVSATGVEIPSFNCEGPDWTLVPTTNPGPRDPLTGRPSTCDKPERLNKGCYENGRFRVITNTADAYVVATCRKRGDARNPNSGYNQPGKYGDIAVIQYSRVNGATCFYQALDETNGLLDGRNVRSPSEGKAAWSWMAPAQVAGIGCVGCHDNGPLIRSPYLTQIEGANALPGKGDNSFNKTEPYAFVGKDFASWKAYTVKSNNNMCTSCHRMSVSNVGISYVGPDNVGRGVTLDFGIRSTARAEPGKNPHGPNSPIWMRPGQVLFSQAVADAAADIRSCALSLNDPSLPPGCVITEYARAYEFIYSRLHHVGASPRRAKSMFD